MAVLIVFIVLILLMILLLANSIGSLVRYEVYQKKWDEVKANRIRIDPNVTKAELCELYVDFCDKYDYHVEF
jgi:hypothetical protein